MMRDFVILIPTHGRADLLGRTLESLAACERPGGYRETIVVENGAPAGTAEIVKAAPKELRARYVHFERANKSDALNHVLETLGDVLVFLTDDDVRLDPRTLVAYERAAAECGAGTFFGGPTRVDYEQRPPEWLIPYFPPSARGLSLPEGKDMVDRPMFMGFNWAAFTVDLKAAGGFDPNRGPGAPTGSTGQETDMQIRLLARGAMGRCVREAIVWHYVPAKRSTAEWLVARAYRHGVGHGIEAVRAGHAKSFWKLRLENAVRSAVRRAIGWLSMSERRQFHAKYWDSAAKGRMDGMKLGLRPNS